MSSTMESDETAFNNEVDKVLQQVCLHHGEVKKLGVLFKDLHNALSHVWKDIHVEQFGSIVTGLGMKGSDVDCYVRLPVWLHPPDKSLVVQARNALMHRRDLFCHPFAIVNAKVPIVRFLHVPTQTNCDVSFTSCTGVQNSKLLRYFLNSNTKVLQLAILIKYWSKIHNLTGSNLMPSYCLTLLIIFFLQQCNILRSVEHLQENTEAYDIDGWNSAFTEQENVDIQNKCLYKLLGDFFKYYNTFEFDKFIISPFIGKPILRECFTKIETVPTNFPLYKSNVELRKFNALRLDTLLCVQDPFEHNRNCAVAVYPKLAQRIFLEIKKAVSFYENKNQVDFLSELLNTTVDNGPVGKKNRRAQQPQHGVRKNYPRHRQQTVRRLQQTYRQNHYRGNNQGAWRY